VTNKATKAKIITKEPICDSKIKREMVVTKSLHTMENKDKEEYGEIRWGQWTKAQ
jgi:hypothetical protein